MKHWELIRTGKKSHGFQDAHLRENASNRSTLDSFPRLQVTTALKEENAYLLDHVHHLPCSTDIHGFGRTGVMLEFLAYFLWKTVPESAAALVLTTSGIVKSD